MGRNGWEKSMEIEENERLTALNIGVGMQWRNNYILTIFYKLSVMVGYTTKSVKVVERIRKKDYGIRSFDTPGG